MPQMASIGIHLTASVGVRPAMLILACLKVGAKRALLVKADFQLESKIGEGEVQAGTESVRLACCGLPDSTTLNNAFCTNKVGWKHACNGLSRLKADIDSDKL